MKALTIWQPWASLIACGAKQFETRSWATKYRGAIAIHAAMKDPNKLSLLDKEALEQIVREEINAGRCPTWSLMPRGAVIATAELVNVWHIVTRPALDMDNARDIDIAGESMVGNKVDELFGRYFVPTRKEIALGDWTPGRYAWELTNVKILPEPIPVKGKQGLWNFEIPE